MSTVLEARWAGPYTSGEIPFPFTVKFDPEDIDFTGFDLAVTIEDNDGSEMTFDGSVAWDEITTGTVLVQLGAADVVVPPGALLVTRRLQIWAGDGVNRPATLHIKFNCHPAIGTPPSV